MTSSSFQPTGDVVDGVRCPAVRASLLLSGDHFASMTFWTNGMSSRPVHMSPGSQGPSSLGMYVALRGPDGTHAPRTTESNARHNNRDRILESLRGGAARRTGSRPMRRHRDGALDRSMR